MVSILYVKNLDDAKALSDFIHTKNGVMGFLMGSEQEACDDSIVKTALGKASDQSLTEIELLDRFYPLLKNISKDCISQSSFSPYLSSFPYKFKCNAMTDKISYA